MTIPLKDLESIDLFAPSWAQEARCEQITDEVIPTLGKKAPLTLPSLERVLVYLDSIASCAFGCHGGDHALERLLFRCCNRARASVRLFRMGFYDESLMITRAVGETANLMLLFAADATAIDSWKHHERWTKSPVEVRKTLELAQRLMAVEQNRYFLLSGIAAHADPEFAPAAHNVLNRPLTPGTFSREGALVCLNEISLPIAFLTFPATTIFQMP
jgi:hypothetical protein